MLGEKEMYKYLGILEVDNIKKVDMKEEYEERVFQENQKVTRDKTILQEPNRTDKYPGSAPRKKLGTTLEVDQSRPQTNGPENKKTNDHA